MNNTYLKVIAIGSVALWSSQTVSAAPPNGRLLASQCFQCHGANGKSISGIDSIAGESVNEIYGEMKEMQAEAVTEPDIMHSQALIYTDEEIMAMAAYLSTLGSGGGGDGDDGNDRDDDERDDDGDDRDEGDRDDGDDRGKDDKKDKKCKKKKNKNKKSCRKDGDWLGF